MMNLNHSFIYFNSNLSSLMHLPIDSPNSLKLGIAHISHSYSEDMWLTSISEDSIKVLASTISKINEPNRASELMKGSDDCGNR